MAPTVINVPGDTGVPSGLLGTFGFSREAVISSCFQIWQQLPTATDALQAGGCIWRGVIAWDKTEGARSPNKAYFRHQCEYEIWDTKGGLSIKDGRGPWPGCLRVPLKQKDKFHLTGNPTDLMRRLVPVAPPVISITDSLLEVTTELGNIKLT